MHRKCRVTTIASLKRARFCTCQLACVDRTSLDIGNSVSLELVDKFCYLSDMLTVDGDVDATVVA